MGRNRTFDETEVVELAAKRFLATGYEATSLDDLVSATGLHRGSLYKAFGSKRGLFVAALKQADGGVVDESRPMTSDALDLTLVALLELAPTDDEVRAVTQEILRRLPELDVAQRLGSRLLERAGIPARTFTTPNR
jgi:TetR/AcrR family transcriptional repressor of nem operon